MWHILCNMDMKELLRGRNEFKFCIDDLKYALEHVGSDYVNWTMINMDDKTEALGQDRENTDKKKTKETYCERVFAYELYHQFRKLMCDDKRYWELLFNGEQRKDESFFKDLFKELEDRDYVIPDLILHKTLGSIDKHDGQILYIEIKTKNSDVFSDLEKLTQLTRTTLNFYYYIFIYVDADLNELKKKIKGDRKKNEYEKIDDNILCFWVKEQKAGYKYIGEITEIIKNDKEK